MNIKDAVVCPRHYGIKICPRALKLHTVKEEYILQMCSVELNLDKFDMFSDIYTTLCLRHFGMKPLS